MTKLLSLLVAFLIGFNALIFFFSESSQGKELSSQSPPQRIISLGPSLTEGIYLLGAEDKLKGVTVFCRPHDTRKIDKIGTVIEINLEKVLSLNPDLVLATSFTETEAIEKLRALKINVVVFPTPKSFSHLSEQFIKLGRLLGKEKLSQEIVTKAKNKVENIKMAAKYLPEQKVFMQVGANPLFTITADSFVNDFIEFAGGVNIAADSKTGLYSREIVLMKNPDVIIIVTMGIVAEEERAVWQRFVTLNAVKNNRIYIMNSYKIGSPTPEVFAATLYEIFGILHPETLGKRLGGN